MVDPVDVLLRSREEVSAALQEQIQTLRDRGLSNAGKPHVSPLRLDGTKIAHHAERVNAWLRGERVAPITIDMALTQKCSYACTFCYAGLQQNPSSPVPWERYEAFLHDCVNIGHAPGEHVKAISLVSDGESTENPYFLDFITLGKSLGIDMAVGTNGLKLPMDEAEQMLKALTYLRININAASPQAYADVMGTTRKNFDRVIEKVMSLVKLKRDLGLETTIGFQMVLLPEYADQALPLAELGRDLGIDYTVIKHCSDDEDGRLGVDYSWYLTDEATELLRMAESMSTESYSVQAKWSKMRTGRERKYSKCFGTALFLQMSGTGIVAPCGSFFSDRYKRFHIGNIAHENFRDIWASDEYWDVMNFLGSDDFDPRSQCATLCLQDKVNEVLFEVKEMGLPSMQSSKDPTPPHVNFI